MTYNMHVVTFFGGPQSWRLGKEPTTPHLKRKQVCYTEHGTWRILVNTAMNLRVP